MGKATACALAVILSAVGAANASAQTWTCKVRNGFRPGFRPDPGQGLGRGVYPLEPGASYDVVSDESGKPVRRKFRGFWQVSVKARILYRSPRGWERGEVFVRGFAQQEDRKHRLPKNPLMDCSWLRQSGQTPTPRGGLQVTPPPEP